ncbi:13461_t:CDS:2 [Dentiscutata erythropus]|uniref:13461_t:CDS:1 n=1 Tax=Dentiscutata erythropus TaxID=1348616 RepID=A0A9N8YUH9_9GLOM|nr:13461_t:CDS:2 [Dentiscutata erythropus]
MNNLSYTSTFQAFTKLVNLTATTTQNSLTKTPSFNKAFGMLQTKTTPRKFLLFDYSKTNLLPVSSFTTLRPHARRESGFGKSSTRMTDKVLEILSNKPNLLLCLWKVIAVRNYTDLIKFGYKNLKANMKYNKEEQTL